MRVKIEMRFAKHREDLVNALANSGYLVRLIEEFKNHPFDGKRYYVEIELPDDCLLKENT